MEVNEKNIDKIIEYMNLELKKNNKLSVNKLCDKLDLKRSTFKNWARKNSYTFDNENKKYIKDIQVSKVKKEDVFEDKVDNKKDVIQMYNKNINIKKDSVSCEIPEKGEVIQKYNKNIDAEKLKELIELIDPIKEVIKEYNKSKTIIDINQVELKPKNMTKVKQKLFKVDVNVLDKWEKFVLEHKQFKVQNLISIALEEFIDKYSK